MVITLEEEAEVQWVFMSTLNDIQLFNIVDNKQNRENTMWCIIENFLVFLNKIAMMNYDEYDAW